MDARVLVPAALENQINASNAHKIRAEIIVEAANGPVAADADGILQERGITVVPDILANAGGVVVSYFEWVQNIQSVSWTEEEVILCIKGDKMCERGRALSVFATIYLLCFSCLQDTL